MTLALLLLVMLVLANGAPVLAHRLFRHRWATPIDGGRLWRDQRPLLGASKTWRGLCSGALASALFSALVGLGFLFGLVFGLLALGGDLLSSFFKRRMGLPSSTRAVGIDQVPESALPVLFAVYWLPLGGWAALGIVLVFVLGNIMFSPMLYRLGIRRHPH